MNPDSKLSRGLCALFLCVALLGCQHESLVTEAVVEEAPPASPSFPSRRGTSIGTEIEFEQEMSELSKSVERSLGELGISLVSKTEGPGSCRYLFKSPGGCDVVVNLAAIVKGASFLRLHVKSSDGDSQLSRAVFEKVKAEFLRLKQPPEADG